LNYEFINTASEVAKIRTKQGLWNREQSQDLEDGVQYILSTEQRVGDIVIMSISEEDLWFRNKSLFDRMYSTVSGKYWNAASSPNKSAAEVVERLLLQMEYLLAKNYRVFVATIPPYETLPAFDYEEVFSNHGIWVLEVNQELTNRIEARNKAHDVTNPASLVRVIDVYWGPEFGLADTYFYDDVNFATQWHQSIISAATKEIKCN